MKVRKAVIIAASWGTRSLPATKSIPKEMLPLLNKQAIYACEFDGVRYDTGTPLGWLKCQLALALKHPQLGPELKEYLGQFL